MADVSVLINGYGTIGKRVADAVDAQHDMEVLGVVKTSPDYLARLAVEEYGYPLFVPEDRVEKFEDAGIEIEGTVEDVVLNADDYGLDVVVDCTPEGIGARNKETLYEKAGVKAIFQGGEEAEVAEVSFVAQCNYEEAVGADYVRCVSCNTTALCRTLGTLREEFELGRVYVTIVRRAADPHQVKKGPINAIVPNPVTVPSHHGPDVRTVMPDIDITTAAVKVPTTLMHMHVVRVELEEEVTSDDVIDAFKEARRIWVVPHGEGLGSTAELIELGRDLGRKRYDLYEILVWEESINVEDGVLYYMQAVHQEADVVPENVDAIRAMTELEEDPEASMDATDDALGILTSSPL
ncbi:MULTISPECIES: type II glyceraldehyde-3-phosphate dehydrogenase [unclassified Methanopyrus]|uniref:type II glyceraldehyde-3-phosphate dehydrogenase n=1 Tax=Methanopyrus sp. SNP6 TaxID=1937005 RepID=UPI0011E5F195|nr:type II glyceraldehyde-3-phosphate dehydrogenase [Methanopyrus sp. SNP6]